jgi:hypothetical protein
MKCCVFVLLVFLLCTLCRQFHWIVHFWMPLRYSLTFINYIFWKHFQLFGHWYGLLDIFIVDIYSFLNINWQRLVFVLISKVVYLPTVFIAQAIVLVSLQPWHIFALPPQLILKIWHYVASFTGLSIFECPFGIL